MPNFGRVSYSLKDIDIVPVSIIHTTDESVDYDLVVAGVRFSDLQKQWKKVHSQHHQFQAGAKQYELYIELNDPISADDHGCDFSDAKACANKKLFKQKIIDAQKAKNQEPEPEDRKEEIKFQEPV